MQNKLYGGILLLLAVVTTCLIVIAFAIGFDARWWNGWHNWASLTGFTLVVGLILAAHIVENFRHLTIALIGYTILGMEVLWPLTEYVQSIRHNDVPAWFASVILMFITYFIFGILLGKTIKEINGIGGGSSLGDGERDESEATPFADSSDVTANEAGGIVHELRSTGT